MLGPSYIGHRSGYVTVDRAPMLVTASGMATHKAGTLKWGARLQTSLVVSGPQHNTGLGCHLG